MAQQRPNYVNPVPPGTVSLRSDQGRDYQGKPGQSIVAIGRARVDAIKSDPGGFGTVVYYTLLDGPSKGTQIYVGHAQPIVQEGDIVNAGQPVAKLLQTPGGNASSYPGLTEIGVAKGGVPLLKVGHGGGELLARVIKGGSSYPAAVDTPPPANQDTTQQQTQQTDTTDYQLQDSINAIPQLPGPPVHGVSLSGDFATTADSGVTPLTPYGQTWQLIASQGNVSPDTLRLAQMAGYSGNAASSG